MGEKRVDVTGETCPVPLVEMRKTVRKASPGDIIIIRGDHPPSKEEIPMAVKSLKLELINIEEENNIWEITIKVPED